IDYRIVAKSPDAIREHIKALRSAGVSVAIADSISNDDLMRLAAALAKDVFVTAGSGLAIGLPTQWGIKASSEPARLPKTEGRKAVISGSCSVATNAQIEHFIQGGGKARSLDPLDLVRNSSGE